MDRLLRPAFGPAIHGGQIDHAGLLEMPDAEPMRLFEREFFQKLGDAPK